MRRDGSVIETLLRALPEHGAEGRVIGTRAMYVDITERKQSEKKIMNQLEELQRWYDATLGREDRVQELKREVNELCRRLGQTVHYPSQQAAPANSDEEKSDESQP